MSLVGVERLVDWWRGGYVARLIGDKTGEKHKIGSNHDTTSDVSVMGQDDSSLSHDSSCGGLQLLVVAMNLLSGLQSPVVSNQCLISPG